MRQGTGMCWAEFTQRPTAAPTRELSVSLSTLLFPFESRYLKLGAYSHTDVWKCDTHTATFLGMISL